MTIALISLMTGKKVRTDFAMTGEITLRGRILPIGGVKEKVLAAFSEGIKNVILPIDNKKDISEIPENLREKIKYHFAEKVDDVIDLVLI
jgi:ATP-dependent Lon protease